MHCVNTSPKRCTGNVNLTAQCDVINSAHPVAVTTIRHWWCGRVICAYVSNVVLLSSYESRHNPFESGSSTIFCVESWLGRVSHSRVAGTVESLQVIGLQARVAVKSSKIKHLLSYVFFRPVTSLGHQGWRRVFWWSPNFLKGPKFFKLCPIVFNCAQHIFPGGRKIL